MVGTTKLTAEGAKLVDLEIAWQDRLEDARLLEQAGRYATAIAAGLYALEIYLKVLICKKLELRSLPKAFEIHDLDGLLILTGRSRDLSGQQLRRSNIKRNWDGIVETSKLLSDLRYKPSNTWDKKETKAFLSRLNDPKDGVLKWLSN